MPPRFCHSAITECISEFSWYGENLHFLSTEFQTLNTNFTFSECGILEGLIIEGRGCNNSIYPIRNLSFRDLLLHLSQYVSHLNLDVRITLPEIPLDMSVCDGCDNEDLVLKQEPMDSDEMKSKDALTSSTSQHVPVDSHLQKVTMSGKL